MKYIDNLSKSNFLKNKKLIAILLAIPILMLFIFTISLIIVYLNLPDITDMRSDNHSQSTKVYDSKNNLLVNIADEENRITIPLSQMPKNLRNSVISMEDERFYKHGGIDIKAITRSLISTVDFTGKLVKSGGSTITQQLAKNLYLTPERNLSRKIKEALLAIKIEKNYSKDKILETYLNEVYWGNGAYGVEAAARTYFGKSAKDLNIGESSLIGGILSAPEAYSPYKSLKMAKWRQDLTLNNMERNKLITKIDNQIARKIPIKLNNNMVKKNVRHNYPYFTSYVISILRDKYSDEILKLGGLKVYTTLDPRSQEAAEIIIRNSVRFLGRYDVNQGALVSVDPNTGYIKSLVGGANFQKSEYNRITQAKRQPGSAFKPIVYLTAFDKSKLTPNSIVVDKPVTFMNSGKPWSPKNYANTYQGRVTVKDAIKYSINTVAVKTLENVGADKVIKTAKNLGINSELSSNLSLALGSSEVSPLEMVAAYSVFATGGKKVEKITPIMKIEDRDGNILEDYTKQQIKEVIPNLPVKMLNDSLRSVVSPSGTGHGAMLSDGRPVAGKTGTTSNNKDAWFIGYIPQLVTLVWVGNDDNRAMFGATGGSTCAPIWKGYMSLVTKNMPIVSFPGENIKMVTDSISENKKEENLVIPKNTVIPVVASNINNITKPLIKKRPANKKSFVAKKINFKNKKITNKKHNRKNKGRKGHKKRKH